MEAANAVEHTERSERHGGILYPLLLLAAIAVIVLSIIGIAAMSGFAAPGGPRDTATGKKPVESAGKPAAVEVPRPEPVPRPGNPGSAAPGGECWDCSSPGVVRA